MSSIYSSVIRGTMQHKVYFTFESYKVYLGQYQEIELAHEILKEAEHIIHLPSGLPSLEDYKLDYRRIIMLCNLRDNHKYIKNAIYLFKEGFYYYLSKDLYLIFDHKDLLFFSTYKIYKRGKYLYFQDSISQKNLLSRFGIPNHSVLNKDYFFKNGNPYDFRRSNLHIINSYKGIERIEKNEATLYRAYIYTDRNITIGHYESDIKAAIAYNKAIDLLKTQGISKNYIYNHIPYITEDEYTELYNTLDLSPRLLHLSHARKRIISTKTYRGISKDRSSYKVHIGYQGRQLYLGMYTTEKRAAQAYNYASLYLYGRQGYINDTIPVVEENDTLKISNFLSKYGIKKGN